MALNTNGMESVIARLNHATPMIMEIMRICGTPGLSLGVQHEAKVIYYDNFGYRDVEAKLRPDEDTVYSISSLTKSFTAATCASLVDKGQLLWDEPVKTYLPSFQTEKDPVVSERATLIDLLAHRTGLSVRNNMWLGADNQLLIQKEDTISMCNIMEPAKPFRQEWFYNNWMYALAGEVIESVTGESYGNALWTRVLDPLGLQRTVTDPKCLVDDNIARPYMALDDGSAVQIPPSQMVDGTVMTPAAGARSCVRDLLKWLDSLMSAIENEKNGQPSNESPLKLVSMLVGGHVIMKPTSKFEQSFGLGWIRTQLPGSLGHVGYNGVFLPALPTVGEGSPSRLILSNSGSTPGFTTAVMMVPETRSAIVVLTNSLGLCDCANWVSQILLHAVFDMPNSPDYIELAKKAAQGNVKMFQQVHDELERNRTQGTSSRPPFEYTGRYFNSNRQIFLDVRHTGGQLKFTINGLDSQTYALQHYHFDTFSFHFARDEQVRRGRFTFGNSRSYLLEFMESDNGVIDKLLWAHDKSWAAGEIFTKTTGESLLW